MFRLFYGPLTSLYFLYAFLFPFSSCSSSKVSALSRCHEEIDIESFTEEVFNALEKVLNYVEANKEFMNIDAVFGLVLGQANMVYLNRYNQIQGESVFLNKSNNVLQRLHKIVEETKRFLIKNQKNLIFLNTVLNYENWMRNITFKNSLIQITSNSFSSTPIDTYKKYLGHLTGSSFNEKNSDDCIIDLLLQQKRFVTKHFCVINQKCYKLFKLDSKDFKFDPAYGVTHSLLFLQIARSQMCELNETNLEKKIKRFCSYIYWEVKQNVYYGFLESLDDLLLEQITLCGYEGYENFITNEIINHVLSIQQPSGCFTIESEEKIIKIKESSRTKRESNFLPENCIDHTTGLGVSTLTLILRYLFYKLSNHECNYDYYR